MALVQRYIQSIPAYIGYTFDPQGTVVQRHRQYDNFVTAADTAVYDAFGALDADVDGLNGGTYTSTDSVGYLGQSGHYTDPETRPVAPGGMVSVGGTYYDARQGRCVTRGEDVNAMHYKGTTLPGDRAYVTWYFLQSRRDFVISTARYFQYQDRTQGNTSGRP